MSERSRRFTRRATIIAIVILLAAVTYLLVAPTPVDPEAWSAPPAPPLTGAFARNAALGSAEWIARGALAGPEASAIDATGRIFSGLADGRVVRIDPERGAVETLANTGGRPLGMAFDANGNLIVADALRGLVSVTPDGKVSVLVDRFEGNRFRFPDDLAIARDGTIYFTDASTRFGMDEATFDVIEHRPRGRVFAFHPGTKSLELVRDGFYFANGIVLTPDETALLVGETSSYRIVRVGLQGAERGKVTPMVENLPGFPDNITISSRGIVWVAIFAPRDALLDRLSGSPRARKMIARLPVSLRPKPKRHAIALGFDLNGAPRYNLQHDDPESFSPVTSVREHGGYLYLGSLERDAMARVRLP